ncbi:hypothetical protein SERLA73DRAFT_186391 [Serpula lacrymans var. lacrymans S7.3]|uniref:Uncharacterized protein n=1 Tax=Serpula lacrymans var. lacrymans (strain S7.3) TaxID=936435 RepID=F8Q776_SERL3|nr:hypothetical protein SERLA73DRAFT_186391 [Serpula lacrymans var. lacrymans S7.3]
MAHSEAREKDGVRDAIQTLILRGVSMEKQISESESRSTDNTILQKASSCPTPLSLRNRNLKPETRPVRLATG